MKLSGVVAVITGASSGLGSALALLLKGEGVKLVVSSRTKNDALEDIASQTGGFPVAADVTKQNEVKHLADAAIKRCGRIDIWINNAGIWLPHVPFEELDFKRAHEMFEVNVFGTMYGSQEALAYMKKQKSGVIVNIVSISGCEPHAYSAAYCASKYAASGFTKSLQKEVEGSGITTMAVYPERMKTNLFDEQKPDDYESYLEPSAVARIIVKNLLEQEPKTELIIGKT